MNKTSVFLIALTVLSYLSRTSAAQTLSELSLPQVKYVIYDNDDHRDVYTEEYLMALSHLGEIELLGMITTYTPNQREYDLFVQGRQEMVELAKASGMKRLPTALAGTSQRLSPPPSNQIKDTRPLDLAASRWLIEQSQKASPEEPMVFASGGQLTVIANSYLLDPTLPDRVIVCGVFGVQQQDYNAGLDGWAWRIVLSKFRVLAIPIGPSSQRGTVYLKPPVVPKSQLLKELSQDIPFFKWMYEKHHPSNALPDGHDYDGQAVIPLKQPDYITKVQRWRVLGLDEAGNLKLEKHSQGHIFEALDAKQESATDEFWRAFRALSRSL